MYMYIHMYAHTIALSHYVEIQMRVLGIQSVELPQKVPQLRSNLPLVSSNVAEGVCDVGEPRVSRLVYVDEVGKTVPP